LSKSEAGYFQLILQTWGPWSDDILGSFAR
jgi:hypothetical protein